MLAVDLQQAVAAVWRSSTRANAVPGREGAVEAREGSGDADELAGVLYASAETLRIARGADPAVMPAAAERLWDQLGSAGPVADQRVPAGGGVGRARRRVPPRTRARRCSLASRRGTERSPGRVDGPPRASTDEASDDRVSREAHPVHPKLRPGIVAARWAPRTLNSRSSPAAVDTHCHLFLMDQEPAVVVEAARAAGWSGMICVGVDVQTSERSIQIASELEGVSGLGRRPPS